MGFSAIHRQQKKTYGRLAAARCTHDAIDEKQGQSRCKRRRVNEGAQSLRDCYFRRVKTLDVHSSSYGEMGECGEASGYGQEARNDLR
jgi:hypothetical protein